MKTSKQYFFHAAAISMAAASFLVHAAASAQQAWPLSNAQHHAFFCGTSANSDQTAPTGYSDALNAALSERVGSGKTTVAGAMGALKSQANCSSQGSTVASNQSLTRTSTGLRGPN